MARVSIPIRMYVCFQDSFMSFIKNDHRVKPQWEIILQQKETSYKIPDLTYIWDEKKKRNYKIPSVIKLDRWILAKFFTVLNLETNFLTETNTKLMSHPLGSGEDSHTTWLCNTDNHTSRTELFWAKTRFIKELNWKIHKQD